MSTNLTYYLASAGPQPALWSMNNTYQAVRVGAGTGNRLLGVVVDATGASINCAFINNNDNTWTLELNGAPPANAEVWTMPATIRGVYISAAGNGTYQGYFQNSAWIDVNIDLVPVLPDFLDRSYAPGGSDMDVWTGSLQQPLSVCGNDPDQVLLMNREVRNFATGSSGTYDFINAQLSPQLAGAGLNMSSWMTQLWEQISFVPAREFIFLGCHDALASYGGKGEGYGVRSGLATGLSYTQDRTVTDMLNDGCRFFDIRFENQWGHHSSVNFNVTQDGFVTELATFFTPSNTNELVIINLDIRDGSVNPSVATLTALYSTFAALVATIGKGKIAPIVYDPTSANPQSSLSDLRAKGNVIFMVNNSIFDIPGVSGWVPPTGIFWAHQSQDAVRQYGDATSAMDYYNDIVENGYVTLPVMGPVFNYLSLTSTGGGIGSSNNDFAQAMNGPMADWLLNATPLNNSMLPIRDPRLAVSPAAQAVLSARGITNVMLPFKETQVGGSLYANRNYNLIGVNFYEKGPFVINAIAQNLMAANYIAGNPPSSRPVNLLPTYGSLQNVSNGGFRTSSASQLSSNYDAECELQFIPETGSNVYAIMNVSNGGYYESSITHLASGVGGDDQLWYIYPSGTGANQYYVQNVANKGYMTSAASQLSATPGTDEVWVIVSV